MPLEIYFKKLHIIAMVTSKKRLVTKIPTTKKEISSLEKNSTTENWLEKLRLILPIGSFHTLQVLV